VWAAVAFLPAAAKPDALAELAATVADRLRGPLDSSAVGIIHASSRLLRTVALLVSDACKHAAEAHHVFDTVQVSLKGQVRYRRLI
jgi:hypothetical protein